MSEQLSSLPTCAMSSWDEFVHPDDRAAVEEARQRRALRVRAQYLIEMREKAGLTQGGGGGGHGVAGNASLLSRTVRSQVSHCSCR